MCALLARPNISYLTRKSFTVLPSQDELPMLSETTEAAATAHKVKSHYHKNCAVPNEDFNLLYNAIGSKLQQSTIQESSFVKDFSSTYPTRDFFNKVSSKLRSLRLPFAEPESPALPPPISKPEAAIRKMEKPMFITTVKSGTFLEPPPEVAALLGLRKDSYNNLTSSTTSSSEKLNPVTGPRSNTMMYSFASRPHLVKANLHTNMPPRNLLLRSEIRREKRDLEAETEKSFIGNSDRSVHDGNTTYEKKISRTSNFTTVRSSNVMSTEQVQSRQAEGRRRAAVRQRAQIRARRLRMDTPPPVDGRTHEQMQTEKYLEELTDRPSEKSIACQADLPIDVGTPLSFPTEMTTMEAETQIYPGDLPEYDKYTHTVVSSIVNKILHEAILEINEEIEKFRSYSYEKMTQGGNDRNSNQSMNAVIITREELSVLIESVIQNLSSTNELNVSTESLEKIKSSKLLEITIKEIQTIVRDVKFLAEIIKKETCVWVANAEADISSTQTENTAENLSNQNSSNTKYIENKKVYEEEATEAVIAITDKTDTLPPDKSNEDTYLNTSLTKIEANPENSSSIRNNTDTSETQKTDFDNSTIYKPTETMYNNKVTNIEGENNLEGISLEAESNILHSEPQSPNNDRSLEIENIIGTTMTHSPKVKDTYYKDSDTKIVTDYKDMPPSSKKVSGSSFEGSDSEVMAEGTDISTSNQKLVDSYSEGLDTEIPKEAIDKCPINKKVNDTKGSEAEIVTEDRDVPPNNLKVGNQLDNNIENNEQFIGNILTENKKKLIENKSEFQNKESEELQIYEHPIDKKVNDILTKGSEAEIVIEDGDVPPNNLNVENQLDSNIKNNEQPTSDISTQNEKNLIEDESECQNKESKEFKIDERPIDQRVNDIHVKGSETKIITEDNDVLLDNQRVENQLDSIIENNEQFTGDISTQNEKNLIKNKIKLQNEESKEFKIDEQPIDQRVNNIPITGSETKIIIENSDVPLDNHRVENQLDSIIENNEQLTGDILTQNEKNLIKDKRKLQNEESKELNKVADNISLIRELKLEVNEIESGLKEKKEILSLKGEKVTTRNKREINQNESNIMEYNKEDIAVCEAGKALEILEKEAFNIKQEEKALENLERKSKNYKIDITKNGSDLLNQPSTFWTANSENNLTTQNDFINRGLVSNKSISETEVISSKEAFPLPGNNISIEQEDQKQSDLIKFERKLSIKNNLIDIKNESKTIEDEVNKQIEPLDTSTSLQQDPNIKNVKIKEILLHNNQSKIELIGSKEEITTIRNLPIEEINDKMNEKEITKVESTLEESVIKKNPVKVSSLDSNQNMGQQKNSIDDGITVTNISASKTSLIKEQMNDKSIINNNYDNEEVVEAIQVKSSHIAETIKGFINEQIIANYQENCGKGANVTKSRANIDQAHIEEPRQVLEEKKNVENLSSVLKQNSTFVQKKSEILDQEKSSSTEEEKINIKNMREDEQSNKSNNCTPPTTSPQNSITLPEQNTKQNTIPTGQKLEVTIITKSIQSPNNTTIVTESEKILETQATEAETNTEFKEEDSDFEIGEGTRIIEETYTETMKTYKEISICETIVEREIIEYTTEQGSTDDEVLSTGKRSSNTSRDSSRKSSADDDVEKRSASYKANNIESVASERHKSRHTPKINTEEAQNDSNIVQNGNIKVTSTS